MKSYVPFCLPIDDTGPHTFAQRAAEAAALGACLAGQTGRPHVGPLLPPGFGLLASFYGTLLAGKSVVPAAVLLAACRNASPSHRGVISFNRMAGHWAYPP